MKKQLIALLILTFTCVASAQQSAPVYLKPNAASPQIGEIEAPSRAVPAEWPEDVEPREGWRPIFYRNLFEVYVDNNDINKNVEPDVGSPYYLQPDGNSPKLAVATENDRFTILSVGTWFSKLQVETIVVGYIESSPPPSSASASPSVENSQPQRQATQPRGAAETAEQVRQLQGTVEKTGLIAKNRFGFDYKLSGNEGKTLAFLDVSQLSDRFQMRDFLNQSVEATGTLQSGNGTTLVLVAQNLKKVDN